ncbi:hypothetical protein GCM10020331_065070 [Ectobacillus funiculus]
MGTSAIFAMDPTKLLISVKELGITGYDAEKNGFVKRFNIEVEMSDLYNILCIITSGDTEEDLLRLVHALKELADEFKHQADSDIDTNMVLPEIPVLALTPRDAFFIQKQKWCHLRSQRGGLLLSSSWCIRQVFLFFYSG